MTWQIWRPSSVFTSFQLLIAAWLRIKLGKEVAGWFAYFSVHLSIGHLGKVRSHFSIWRCSSISTSFYDHPRGLFLLLFKWDRFFDSWSIGVHVLLRDYSKWVEHWTCCWNVWMEARVEYFWALRIVCVARDNLQLYHIGYTIQNDVADSLTSTADMH